ncbi:myb-like protein X [Capsicum chacoense]
MSRCFPFPPPGYEKKHPRPEDRDLLKEEKRKEKKHKREKDKDKKEGKEKRDKERSDGKHREKKDKKDKHRDKKEKRKDKKKDKDKEKSDLSEEAKVAGVPGASSGEKLPSGDEHFKNESINSQEAKFHEQSHVQHAEKLFKSSLPAVETEESKFVQELARRIRDEEKGAVSQLAERFPVESNRYEKTNNMYIKDSGNSAKEKDKNKERSAFSNNMDGQQVRVEPRIGANARLPSFSEVANSKFHGSLPPREEKVEHRREEKEKSKERRDDKPRDKKNKEKDAKSHGKEKEKKKEEKGNDRSAHKKSEPDKSRDMTKSNFVGVSSTNHQIPPVLKDTITGVTEGNHRKRKDIETNGFLHESEVRPAKLLRPLSSHQPTLNGKRLETHQKADLFSSNKQGVATDTHVINKERSLNGTVKLPNKHGVGTDIEMGNKERGVNGTINLPNKQGVATDILVGNKERGINGTIKGQPLAMSKRKASSMSPGADQIAEASKRPHPDSKYLNQILSVPKMDEGYKHGVATDIEVGNKERGANGTIKGQPLAMSNPKTSMSPGADQIAEASKRPHPDSKYLNQILSVPKMDEEYKHGVATDIEVGNKERGANGTIGGQPLTMSKPKTSALPKLKASSVSPGADEIAEASKRPPHPDSKYLNQILSVPKMEEWSGFDDQEWLFGSKSTPVRKPNAYPDEVKDHRVWSEALQIDSADVCALPYVLPY